MGNVANRVFESAGPDGKVRGTPQQIIDKYQALARDAQLSGDRVIAENYLQHSEHYSRLLGEATRHLNEQRAAQQERENAQQDRDQSHQQRSDQQSDDDDDGDGRDAQRNRDRQSGEDREHRDDRREREYRQNRAEARDGDRGDRQSADDQPRDESGLTTIDPGDGQSESGPVETPEGRRRNTRVTRPAPREEARPAEAEATSADEAAPQQPTKRPRTRRKAKAETDADTATVRAE
jgi:hypothetical protein